MYQDTLNLIDNIFYGFLTLSLVLMLPKVFYHVYGIVVKQRRFPEAKQLHKFAILIPARYESKVIRKLLDSLQNSTYPQTQFDVYVIVEAADDPTCALCQDYANVSVFVRPNLDVKTKGGALDQLLQHLIQSGTAQARGYEAYFIFDADNVVAATYLEEMNKVYDAGYDLAMGYRNTLNWNDGWIAGSSAILFSMLNTFSNKCRANISKSVVVSGTGFYIAAKVIHELGGWTFHSLTEDVEISYYATLHNLKGAYYPYAEFWDEQPKTNKASCRQRLRWVKGFFQVNHQYHRQMRRQAFRSKQQRWSKFDLVLNVIPVIITLATLFIYGFVNLGFGLAWYFTGVAQSYWWQALLNVILVFSLLYAFFFAYGVMVLCVEHRHIQIKPWHALSTCILFPFYMAQFIPIVFLALFKRNVTWQTIEHRHTSTPTTDTTMTTTATTPETQVTNAQN